MSEESIEILLVDDDEMTIFIHERILQKCSLNRPYKSFYSADDCLNYLKQRRNDPTNFVILLDINMPHQSGWDMLERLDDSFKGVVIMATSSIDSDDRLRAEKYSQVVDFFEKPLTIEQCERLTSRPEVARLL